MANEKIKLNKYQQIIIAIIALIVVVGVIINLNAISNRKWVASRYGNICYVEGNEHKNIEYKIYFDTIDECLDFVKN